MSAVGRKEPNRTRGGRNAPGDIRRLGKLLRLLGRKRYRSGLMHGVAAGVEHAEALSGLRLSTAVDIGANQGQFSLFLAASFPDIRIHAFEPLPRAAAKFRSLFRDDARVRLHQAAVGRRRGRATLHVAARDDSSSLLPITPLQEALFPGTHEVGTVEVETAPLESFLAAADIAAPALLKIDVQGFELEALRGCAALLPRFAHVYVECSYAELYAGQALADEVDRFLADHGFRPAGVFNLVRDGDGRPVQGDFLFEATDPHTGTG